MSPTIEQLENHFQEKNLQEILERTQKDAINFRDTASRLLNMLFQQYHAQKDSRSNNDYIRKIFIEFGSRCQVIPEYYLVTQNEDSLILHLLSRISEHILQLEEKNLRQASILGEGEETHPQRLHKLVQMGDEIPFLESEHKGQFYFLTTVESPEGSKTYPAVERLYEAQQEILEEKIDSWGNQGNSFGKSLKKIIGLHPTQVMRKL